MPPSASERGSVNRIRSRARLEHALAHRRQMVLEIENVEEEHHYSAESQPQVFFQRLLDAVSPGECEHDAGQEQQESKPYRAVAARCQKDLARQDSADIQTVE